MKLLNALAKQIKSITPRQAAVFTLSALILTVMFGGILAYNIKVKENQQFIYLADSFLKGKLHFQEKHAEFLTVRGNEHVTIWTDTSLWQGKQYWPLGPFPAVALMPFVAIFSTKFLQGYLSFLLTLLNFFLLRGIAKKLNLKNSTAIWFASFFIFGSAYLGIAAFSVSWYFAQVIAVTLLLFAIYEFLRSPNPKWWLIGVYLALATLARSHLFLAAIFFILMIFWHHQDEKKICQVKEFMLSRPRQDKNKLAKHLFGLLIPIGAALGLLLIYNWARFGNPLETGYGIQDIPPQLARARDVGLFSLKHIPGNLYFMLFRGLDPVLATPDSYVLKYPYITASIWGLGIFFTSPLLLYVFSAPWRDRMVKAASTATFVILLPIITYYGIGVSQIGYRYALDFYPFLYLILCKTFVPKIPLKAKILIVIGIILNWHLLLHFRS